jgi:cysteine desulfuration protein SufE
MSSSIAEREAEVVEEFALFDDWMDKYAHLIEQARDLAPMDEALKTDERIVRGCQSRVWLHADRRGETVHYQADSDALITKGLVALLLRVLDGQPAREVAAAPLRFLDEIGLQEHLSPNRANGLAAMVARLRAEAAA